MGPLDLLSHLSSFVAPAVAVGVLLALAGRLFIAAGPDSGSWWFHAAMNSIAGSLVLGAGLWYFGVDGKMATYSALVIVTATTQWIGSRAWRR